MDHTPIRPAGQGGDVTPGRWPWNAVPGRSAWDDEVVEQARVAEELGRRDVAAGVEQTGGWVMCLALPCTKALPDRCPDCGNLEILYGGGRAAHCGGCGRLADDQAVFEVEPCYVLAANHDGGGWGASVQTIETGDCLGDTFASGMDPIAPAGAHPALVADVLLGLDWAGIVRRCEGRV